MTYQDSMISKIKTNNIQTPIYNDTPSEGPMDSITYLQSMYDIWEQKQGDKWEKLESLSETMLNSSNLPNKMEKMMDIKSIISKLSTGIDMTCSWWSLPKWIQDLIQPLTKTKKSWTMPLYKDGTNTDWYMDIPMLLTWKETLTGGTEKCLDWWYQKLTGNKPDSNSKMTITLSQYPLENPTTCLTLQGDDELWKESSYYLDTKSQMICWLCPYLPWLMGGKPKQMWLTIIPN